MPRSWEKTRHHLCPYCLHSSHPASATPCNTRLSLLPPKHGYIFVGTGDHSSTISSVLNLSARSPQLSGAVLSPRLGRIMHTRHFDPLLLSPAPPAERSTSFLISLRLLNNFNVLSIFSRPISHLSNLILPMGITCFSKF